MLVDDIEARIGEQFPRPVIWVMRVCVSIWLNLKENLELKKQFEKNIPNDTRIDGGKFGRSSWNWINQRIVGRHFEFCQRAKHMAILEVGSARRQMAARWQQCLKLAIKYLFFECRGRNLICDSMSVTFILPAQLPTHQSTMAQQQRVLSIQSHVVRGHVGNKSAVFPLQVCFSNCWWLLNYIF